MHKNTVMEKSFDFSLKIIKIHKHLISNKKEYVLSKQLLKSGTSIGALIKEAEHAQSKKDFINKMSIALKEANETEYWLILLKESDYLSSDEYKAVYDECIILIRLLISIVKTSKSNLN